jgi:hypothetical protein
MTSTEEIVAVFRRLAKEGDTSLDVEHEIDPPLSELKLYPFHPLLQLGDEIGAILEKEPALSIEIVLRLSGSSLPATRALACVTLSRLARYNPAPWMELAHHLAADENWEVREYAAHIFDTHGEFEGLAAFHLDFCFEVLSKWVGDEDYRVRRVPTNALLGYFLRHPEIGTRLLSLLEPLLTDDTDYVRRNLVFALRTVGKKRPELVFSFLEEYLDKATAGVGDIFRLTLDHRWTRGHEATRDRILQRLGLTST